MPEEMPEEPFNNYVERVAQDVRVSIAGFTISDIRYRGNLKLWKEITIEALNRVIYEIQERPKD